MLHSHSRRNAERLVFLALRVASAVLLLGTLTCGPEPPPTRTERLFLIGIDGGTLPRVRELAREGRLPNFARVMSEGAVGRLASIYSNLPFSPRRGGGYWSPLIWPSIATGKEPAAHGIIDFRLPSRDVYRICTRPGAREAEVSLPRPAEAVAVRIVRPADPGKSSWSVRLRDEPGKGPIDLSGTGSLDLPLPPLGSTPEDIVLRFEAVSPPFTPLCLNSPDLLDANGNVAMGMDLVTNRTRFALGWADPIVGKLRGVGSDNRRVRAIWNILSEHGKKVAVIGWRDSWPAEPVNGYFISDRLGWRPIGKWDREKAPLGRLTFPEELEESARPLLERFPEVDSAADKTVLSVAPCALDDFRGRVGRLRYSEDWLHHRLASMMLERDPSIRFLAVYYGGIDGYGHMFLAKPKTRDVECGIGPALSDRYYEVMDGYLGDWLERMDADSTLVLVSDHGMTTGEIGGDHSDDGFVMLMGKNVRRGAEILNAGVLDVTPTILGLFDLPLATDMKGRPLWNGLLTAWREACGRREIATYGSGTRPLRIEEPSPGDEVGLAERLRALGYIN